MFRRWVWLLLLFAALLLPGPAATRAADAQRIIAIGDLHGDYDAWRAIARAAGLVDGKGKWSGGSTVLVQLGDVVDRGPDSLKIIHDLMRLQREAPRRGGRVYALVGNHEAMNMTGDLRYVHPGEFAVFADRESDRRRQMLFEANQAAISAAYRAQSPTITADGIRREWMKTMPLGRIEHQLAWKPDGQIGRWILRNPAVVKIGGTLFAHGGVSAAYANVRIDDMNRQVAAALQSGDERPTSIINDPRGPLWYRGLITRTGDDETTAPPVTQGQALNIDQEIDLVCRAFGVKRIVVGHTPSVRGIVSIDNGRLWQADSGNSRAYNGVPSYLEIVGDRLVAHAVPRPTGASWGRPQ